MMPGLNYVIFGWSSERPTPGVSLHRSLTLEGNTAAVITQDRVIDDNQKSKLKTKLCVLAEFSY